MRGSDDFFHSRIDQMIDLRHPLAVLASHMPWQEIEASLAKQLAREVKKGRSIQEMGLFGSQTVVCWRRLKTDHLCRMKIDQGLLLA